VIELPEGATVIARSDFCPHAAIVYGDRALTFQAHPEFGPEIVEGLAELRPPEDAHPDQIDAALDKLDTVLANEIVADQIADFFRLPRQA
jgi:GMP synthase (glutamine-hydrolysing)